MRLLSAKWSTSKSNCYLSAASQVVDTLTIHICTFNPLLAACGAGCSKGKTAAHLPATCLDTLCQKARPGSWEGGSFLLTWAPYCRNQGAGGRMQNQRIRGWFGLEGTLKGHIVGTKTSCSEPHPAWPLERPPPLSATCASVPSPSL